MIVLRKLLLSFAQTSPFSGSRIVRKRESVRRPNSIHLNSNTKKIGKKG